MVEIPVIDFSAYDPGDDKALAALAIEVDRACRLSGFMKIRHLGVPDLLVDEMFGLSKRFFEADVATKARSAYQDAAENFGYQGVGLEYLDPMRPADIKETFTMRDLRCHDPEDKRWPNVPFRDTATEFYEACLQGAYRIQRVLARALCQPDDFFVQYHQGENVSLRLLYYPAMGAAPVPGQLGAGAHTDYGLITLLFQRNVSGLQVQDAAGSWHDVAPEPDVILINTGDLMERWTNGAYRSTPHRVQPKLGLEDRYSMALFVDPDTDTPVSVLESCLAEGESPRYPDVTAGEHIQERIMASHQAADKTV